MPRPAYRYLHTGYPCVLVRIKDDPSHPTAQGQRPSTLGTHDPE